MFRPVGETKGGGKPSRLAQRHPPELSPSLWSGISLLSLPSLSRPESFGRAPTSRLRPAQLAGMGQGAPLPGARPRASIAAFCSSRPTARAVIQVPIYIQGAQAARDGETAWRAGGSRGTRSRPLGLTRTHPMGSRLTGSQDHAGLTPPRGPRFTSAPARAPGVGVRLRHTTVLGCARHPTVGGGGLVLPDRV